MRGDHNDRTRDRPTTCYPVHRKPRHLRPHGRSGQGNPQMAGGVREREFLWQVKYAPNAVSLIMKAHHFAASVEQLCGLRR